MKKEVAARWVAELRSGKWKQGTGMLHFQGRLCCLGVLCEIALEDGVPIRAVENSTDRIDYDECDTLPPRKVTDWAGMSSPDGRLFDGGDLEDDNNLANLNDGGYTFEQIADVIEMNWEKL